ncbi:hypothetical protein DSO57_1033712 [Entomophthora muscae]|uniref:Uncharacterized protein n=1 Tax=Entomophthora muscae TaxID=34485 RepID=A0ACC2TM36_9FUNG|nr:hypothetical protein DSO57_1033712 [Entomophthora muscae]
MASSESSFVLLPNHILEEIFLYLGNPGGTEVRLACRELYCLTEPMFLQIHTLGDIGNIEYLQFLFKKAKPIRGLKIQTIEYFHKFEEAELTLCEVFPSLRSISLSQEEELASNETEILCKHCLGLKNLKHLSLTTPDSGETSAVMRGEFQSLSEDEDSGFYLTTSSENSETEYNESWIETNQYKAISIAKAANFMTEEVRHENNEDDNNGLGEYTPLCRLIPLMSKLESLYISSFPLSLIKSISRSKSMKKLTIATHCDQPFFLSLRKLIPVKEVMLYNTYGPIISSIEESQTWFYTYDVKTHFYWRLPDHVKIQETKWVQRVFPNFFCIDEEGGYSDFMCIMEETTVEHCTVICTEYDDIRGMTLDNLESVPSIEMVYYGPTGIEYDQPIEYVAKKLSLDIFDKNELYKVLGWVLQNFSHLQDFYVFNEFSDDVLPFRNTFSLLKCFYSDAPQSDEFWCQLLSNAPKLEAIYTDHIPEYFSLLKAERPTLQLFPFEAIYGAPRIIEEFSGFYESLDH